MRDRGGATHSHRTAQEPHRQGRVLRLLGQQALKAAVSVLDPITSLTPERQLEFARELKASGKLADKERDEFTSWLT